MTDEQLTPDELITNLWQALQPSVEAQGIRARMASDLVTIEDELPEYVWDLIDIAAQRGIELGGMR